jgi:hypothetical protein
MKPAHIAVLALLALSACKSQSEVASGTVTDPDTGETTRYPVKSDRDDGTIDIRTDNGTMQIRSGADAPMPAGFPAYPGATANGGSAIFNATGANGGSGGMTSFLTDDPPEKVIAFYRDAATRQGYAINAEANMGPMRMIGSEGKDGKGGFQLMVQRDPASGKTSATLLAAADK